MCHFNQLKLGCYTWLLSQKKMLACIQRFFIYIGKPGNISVTLRQPCTDPFRKRVGRQ